MGARYNALGGRLATAAEFGGRHGDGSNDADDDGDELEARNMKGVVRVS